MAGSGRTPWGTRARALKTAAERSFSTCTGKGAAAPGELRTEGSSQLRAPAMETISQGTEVNMQSLWQLRVLPSDVKKSERNFCSVRRKGLDGLVVRVSFLFYLTKSCESFYVCAYGCIFEQTGIVGFVFKYSVLYWGAW